VRHASRRRQPFTLHRRVFELLFLVLRYVSSLVVGRPHYFSAVITCTTPCYICIRRTRLLNSRREKRHTTDGADDTYYLSYEAMERNSCRDLKTITVARLAIIIIIIVIILRPQTTATSNLLFKIKVTVYPP